MLRISVITYIVLQEGMITNGRIIAQHEIYS